jgi:hypothetical protein
MIAGKFKMEGGDICVSHRVVSWFPIVARGSPANTRAFRLLLSFERASRIHSTGARISWEIEARHLPWQKSESNLQGGWNLKNAFCNFHRCVRSKIEAVVKYLKQPAQLCR